VKNIEGTTIGRGDTQRLPIIPGTYPAHVTDLAVAEYNGNFVYNLTFKIAPEVEKIVIDKMVVEDGELVKVTDSEGNSQKINATYLSGKQFRNSGVWLTPNPEDSEKWKNRKYKHFFESLGVIFDTDESENTVLGAVEETDVRGLPCLVKIMREEYQKDGMTKHAWKVNQVYPWQNGNKLTEQELDVEVPF